MVRVPRGMILHGLAGSQYAAGAAQRRIPRPPDHLYDRPVTVDLGNDGMAPTAVFTAAGTATALVGPSGGGDSWSLDQCSVSTSVGLLDSSQCIVFVGPQPVPQCQVAPTLAGGGSQFGLGGIGLSYGWFVWAVWTGGTPGATGTLRVTGQKTVLSN